MERSELYRYTGNSPRPDDFDSYWSIALAELDTVAPDPVLVESDFQAPNAKCYDLYFTGVRGARIHARYLRPAVIEKPLPAVMRFHGYRGSAGDWWDKLAFVAGGFCYACMDTRGQNGISQDTGSSGASFNGHVVRGMESDDLQDLMMRHIFLDAVQLARVLASFDEVDETKMAALGGSQAGGISVACAALYGKLNRIAVCEPFLADYYQVYKQGYTDSAFAEIWEYFRTHDPRHLQEERFFHRLGYIDISNLAPRITDTKTFLVTGLRDVTVPAFTHFAVYNRIPGEKKLHIYPDHWHEPLFEAYDDLYRFLLEMREG